MAVTICWNDKSILRCANWVFRYLYYTMEEIIEKHEINLVIHLKELIKELELGGDGIGLDILDYMYSKEDLLSFINLVKEANIEIFKHPDIGPYKHHYENFYRELVEIYKSFEPEPISLRSAQEFDFYIKNPDKCSRRITYNKNYLLACSLEVFNHLFKETLPIIITLNNITLSENLTKLIKTLQETESSFYGDNTDIRYYIHSKNEISFFATLIRKSIDILEKNPDGYHYHIVFYEKFYNNLLKTIENFPDYIPQESQLNTVDT